GADAVIVQDLAVAALARDIAPALALHASTQMSVTNLAAAKELAAFGFQRVILARELTAAEIRHITANCGIETEIFVHGAHCMSVSGQCYMSAFYGGRSGNRGACAGPCRLPYTACGKAGPLLGLRDLSLMEHLPEIRDMGVACVKIEGRLRTPEYVAAAVDAARCALAGETYDRERLEKAFSRSGFTAGFYENDYLSAAMFGRRTEEDSSLTKAALPALRELYRREHRSVPVSMHLAMAGDRVSLRVSDGAHSVLLSCPAQYEDAKSDPAPALRRSLEKTGGTPFYAQTVACDLIPGKFYPPAAVNELRRRALEELLEQRGRVVAHLVHDSAIAVPARSVSAEPKLRARLASAAQLTPELANRVALFSVPLAEADKVPSALRERAVAELPRAIFDEEDIARQLLQASELGYQRFCAGSICGVALIKQILPKAVICGGFGMNSTNGVSVETYAALGVSEITLSPELTLAAANAVGGSIPRGVLVYGHLPLMLVRACPLRGVTDCATCKRQGSLVDRKGMVLRVECHGTAENGAREIYNPVPLYLGDRMREVKTEFATLYFTRETAQEVLELLDAFHDQRAAEGEFTRGLYYKGVF
ncbi:MAG: U32 family peptidase, partial [Pygmaiobacter sp.]